MAKTAADYPVTFGYLEKTTLNGQPYTHRGEDRPTPTGTPIVIEGVNIGLTGATGLVTGPHLHIQAGTDQWAQNTVKPTTYSFKPGTVTHTGFASQWGNHVIIKVGTRYVVYAHLSKINVKKGQVIKGGDMVDDQQLNDLIRHLLGKTPTAQDRAGLLGKPYRTVRKSITDGNTYKNRVANAKAGKLKAERHLPNNVRNAYVDPLISQVSEYKAKLSLANSRIQELETELDSVEGGNEHELKDLYAKVDGLEKQLKDSVPKADLVELQKENDDLTSEVTLLTKEKQEAEEQGNRFIRWLGEQLKKIGF